MPNRPQSNSANPTSKPFPLAQRRDRVMSCLVVARNNAKQLVLTALILLGACADVLQGTQRPQDPTDRPYRIEQVSFASDPETRLAGELTLPANGTGFRAVVLLSGTGPQDRNEALAGHRPFLVLSDHLTRAGYAVLRFDDRGVGESTGDHSTASLWDFTNDAVGAYRFLRSHPDIDPSAIGFIGHSEGGYHATEAALRVNPAFSVTLAGAARRLLPEVLVTQTQDILSAEGKSQDHIDLAVRQIRAGSAILARPVPLSHTRAELDAYLMTQGLNWLERRENVNALATPWGVSFAQYDPTPSIRALSMPVLALFGEKDLQVSAREEAPVMRGALRHPASEVSVVSGVNHLFQPADTGLPAEYEEIETTIAPKVLNQITNWLDGL